MMAEGWNGYQALYFLMVTASTVGYGDMNPTRGVGGTDASLTASRIFTVVYIFFGISVVFAQLSAAIGAVFNPAMRWTRIKLELAFPQDTIDLDGDGVADFKIPRAPIIYYGKNLLAPTTFIVVVQVCFAAIFVAIEPGWDFGTAMYHCMVTATTVGFGDVSITTDRGRMWAFFHILISVSLLAALLGQLGELADQRKLMLQKLELVKGSLDIDLMMSLDKDGDGVDKFEFVIGMLTKLKLLDANDVEVFTKLFAKMDADGSGKLTRDDIDAARANSEGRFASLCGIQETSTRVSPQARRIAEAAVFAKGRSVSVTKSSTVTVRREGSSEAFSDHL